MTRAFLIVMDSVGLGGAPDADAFFNGDLPDEGANTIAHIAAACAAGRAEEGRSGLLHIPHLDALGLGAAMGHATSDPAPGLTALPEGLYGVAAEVSPGKDTPSGHWELAGVPVPWDWHYFPPTLPSFPQDLMDQVAELCGAGGTLANCHASGTEVIKEWGAQHIETGWPICYTSADSVFQIAAHEAHFGLERLLKLCQDIAPILHKMKVGRVIARPFVGTVADGFSRTGNRHDYAIAPPAPTICDWAKAAGRSVYAIGKIGDIFSMQGIDEVRKGTDAVLFDHLCDVMEEAPDGSLTFANFVEFDSLYGHRRDVSGYARHLEWFDAQMARLYERARPGDLLIFTADHGNDPTWPGTDHTREQVPVLGYGLGVKPIGPVAFTDVAASLAEHLGIAAQGPGRSFL
ncbi:phosphopentomutase [Celeribacter baekdonensis]|uniref:Phosphopentomutase n=1 Tax=Celeribacter baekdonensis TaxID=875171 RepID=A0A1G7NS05_9RHOB|nr:phosphopentomutase [Celeribacter baekdonensis]SDF76868.1 phosphopentomutase [Celeribacter baekdonensis]